MYTKTKQKMEFGDFQTPDVLARAACEVLHRLRITPGSILEPTCGEGSFLRASTDFFPTCDQVYGFDINPEYTQVASSVKRATVYCQDFFQVDWPVTLQSLREPILVIGNPPWVTNSAVGVLGGTNLPNKSNFQGRNGFEAVTGKSNFDISEWMLLHLLEWLSGRKAILAMLCKTGVARKVLCHAWSRDLEIAESRVFPIDAIKYFNASVDACLLVAVLEPGATSKECMVYQDLKPSSEQHSTLAFRDGLLIANLDSYSAYGHMSGASQIKWRSGVKHDCSRVMELRRLGCDEFQNGFGDAVSLELTNLYPMLKSSDLLKSQPTPSRYMLVPQHHVGEDTSRIKQESPRTWEYLQSHGERLDRRRSSIYENRPRFSVFGVGPYSFAPWKVAISGFAKRLEFHCIGPYEEKPVVVDDTCYFLPCDTEEDARVLTNLLNSEMARGFFQSFIFWDAKRPITAQLLNTLALKTLAEESGLEMLPLWSGSGPEHVSRLL